MKRRSRILVTDPLPFPRNEERRSVFVTRFCASSAAKHEFETPAKRAIAAEKTWQRAKQLSLVSITTSEAEFLLFD